MPTLEDDKLVFRFPEIDQESSFSIDFQRTLRIPDTEETYPLPPGLGSFPLRHVEDYRNCLPDEMSTRGGVVLPMWQAEAMWINFKSAEFIWDSEFPVAIKIAAGKINAVTGEVWRPHLHRGPQDYVVSTEQPWLDGFAIAKGVIRQFVAMPLGSSYSVEEQLTGSGQWGGLQISVTPLKASVWNRIKGERRSASDLVTHDCKSEASTMGLAAGGKMDQSIYHDPFQLDDWDITKTDRVFVSLVHAKDWKDITGENAPNEPPTAEDYTSWGLPWFKYYGNDQQALEGAPALANVQSLATAFNEKTGVLLPHSQVVENINTKTIGPRIVCGSDIWDI